MLAIYVLLIPCVTRYAATIRSRNGMNRAGISLLNNPSSPVKNSYSITLIERLESVRERKREREREIGA